MSRTIPRRTLCGILAAAALAAGVALTGCAAGEPAGQEPPSVTAPTTVHDLDGLDAAEVIDRLDRMPVAERPAGLLASVRPGALVIRDQDGGETTLPMPADQVYVSVAPYETQTHDCHFHSLTTCRGELGDTEIRVTLTGTDGEVLLEETRRTFDNGFTGLWLPRGIEASLTVQHGDRSGTAEISTIADDDATCVTTLRLS